MGLLQRLEERGGPVRPLFRQLFGFCPVHSSPGDAAGGAASAPAGARSRWANGLIFARMAGDIGLRGCGPATALPSFDACLAWVHAAMAGCRHGDDFYEADTALARQLRQEELYLRTHIVYTQAGYRHAHAAAGGGAAARGCRTAAHEDRWALERLLRTLLREGGEAPTDAAALRAAARRPDMMGEALDCLKALAVAQGSGQLSFAVGAAEEMLLGSQGTDGGWPHDEGRRHHSTFVAIWGLRDVQ
jgi:hypothetical protein